MRTTVYVCASIDNNVVWVAGRQAGCSMCSLLLVLCGLVFCTYIGDDSKVGEWGGGVGCLIRSQGGLGQGI